MKGVLDALTRLQMQPELLRRSILSSRVDGPRECQPLYTTLETLRKFLSTVSIRKPSLDPEVVWRALEQVAFQLESLDGLQIRTLCTDENTVLRPQFISALRKSPEILKRSVCLYGLVNAYFSRWRTMDSPEAVEELIRNAIARYDRPNSVLETWRKMPELFSAAAAQSLAEAAIQSQADPGNVLNEKFVGSGTALSLMMRASTAVRAAEHFRRQEIVGSEASNLAYLEWMTSMVLVPPVPTQPYCAAVGTLIMSRSAERSQVFQEKLREYIRRDKRLGDPRLGHNRPHWSDMETEAEKRFFSWLARESIQFFFHTILPDNSHNRLRKEFWLLYVDRLSDFQVAVSERDLWKVRSSSGHESLGAFSRVSHPTTSAFLMQFQGYGKDFVIVEFSETGNAARIYERKEFEATNVNLRTPLFDKGRHLQHNRFVDRIIHVGQWWRGARMRLAELGIRP